MIVQARVWRECRFQWWAELWRTSEPQDPPNGDVALAHDDRPLPIDGYTKIAVELRSTRGGAERAARKMLARVYAGQSPKKSLERPIPYLVDTSRPGSDAA